VLVVVAVLVVAALVKVARLVQERLARAMTAVQSTQA
jgi:hypothetical protein